MKYDVVICGAGSSGFTAAVACKRNGAKVLLVEESGTIGGTNVLSLVTSFMTFHSSDKQIVKGIAQEIITRLVKRGKSLGHIADPLDFCSTITPVDLEGLRELYFEMLVEEDIDILFHTFIYDVVMDNNKIKAIKCVNKDGASEIEADIFIDATGDGDVAKYANVPYTIGRTSDNLCQPMSMLFTMGNVDLDKVLAYIKDNKNDFVLRDDFDYKYVGVSGFFKKVAIAKRLGEFCIPRDRVLFFQDVKKNEVTINMTRVQGYSSVDAVSLSKAEVEGRMQIRKAINFMTRYIPGFEDAYLVRTPETIGVRESRHFKGLYTLTADDILNNRCFDDAIALCAFPMDIHSPNENSLVVAVNPKDKSYEIPLRIMLTEEVDNLIITGRPVSATFEAAASMRITPTAMALGEAGGVLAALAIKQKKNIKKVDYKDVQNQLSNEGQTYKRD